MGRAGKLGVIVMVRRVEKLEGENVPYFAHPRLYPLLLGLTYCCLERLGLARALGIAWSVADGAVSELHGSMLLRVVMMRVTETVTPAKTVADIVYSQKACTKMPNIDRLQGELLGRLRLVPATACGRGAGREHGGAQVRRQTSWGTG